ncbi:Sirohydrochlorin cobaltochelatase [Rosistilla oblonga]|uniref:sirohydrochlorin chelatase n=1 Tax=Rosistilla oblonga TaxID=2527990 RepID=UPI00118B58BF|nr:sirohydrochlorin chelatase [Rosistilla oblonga]QDV13883.1 Sirohydrochlorin cobaltochelatase [Rosistilla oblonga]
MQACTRPGYLLIGHGTRDLDGTKEFLQLGAVLGQLLAPAPVEACFLELQQPTIGEAWQRMVASNVDGIYAVPLLLFAAGHAKRDIPEELQAACDAAIGGRRGLPFVQTPPLQCHPKLLELSAIRAQQAIDAAGGVDLARTALVMVGRGSLDDGATAEMYRFSELRGQSLRPAVVRTGFVAMARPDLASVLDEVAQLPEIDTIVVQPHLLFQGDLNQRVVQMIDAAADRHGDRRWIAVDRLGPDPRLAQALIELAAEID